MSDLLTQGLGHLVCPCTRSSKSQRAVLPLRTFPHEGLKVFPKSQHLPLPGPFLLVTTPSDSQGSQGEGRFLNNIFF